MTKPGTQQHRFPTGLEIAQSYADGKNNPVEVAKRALAKAAEVPSVFLSVTPERALREAEASAERWRKGVPLSALDGVPIAWKDLFNIAGTVTTAGSKVFSERPAATADAPLVASLSLQDFPHGHFDIEPDGVFAPTSGRGAPSATVDASAG